MKTERKLLIGLLLMCTIMCCNNDDDDDEDMAMDDPVLITVDDAAELVAASMAIATYGAVDNMNYVSDQIVDLLDCGESQSEERNDTEISDNGNITVTFSISESYSLTCEDSLEMISYDFNGNQSITSDPLDTEHDIIGSWTITGAEESSTTLSYNGSYSRGGAWIYNEEENHIDSTTTSFVYSDVEANKSDNVIFNGTSTFEISGTSTVYEPYSYSGDIVFNENNICVATFSSGEQYEIDLNTGDVSPL